MPMVMLAIVLVMLSADTVMTIMDVKNVAEAITLMVKADSQLRRVRFHSLTQRSPLSWAPQDALFALMVCYDRVQVVASSF